MEGFSPVPIKNEQSSKPRSKVTPHGALVRCRLGDILASSIRGELSLAVASNLTTLQRVRCSSTAQQLFPGLSLIADWFLMTHASERPGFSCPRTTDQTSAGLPARYLQLFRKFGCTATRPLVSALLSFSASSAGRDWKGGVSLDSHFEQVMAAMLVDASFGGAWLPANRLSQWLHEAQIQMAGQDRLFGHVWQLAVAMVQVRRAMLLYPEQLYAGHHL